MRHQGFCICAFYGECAIRNSNTSACGKIRRPPVNLKLEVLAAQGKQTGGISDRRDISGYIKTSIFNIEVDLKLVFVQMQTAWHPFRHPATGNKHPDGAACNGSAEQIFLHPGACPLCNPVGPQLLDGSGLHCIHIGDETDFRTGICELNACR